MPTSKNVFQLKISLDDSKPPIWRRVLVPEDCSLQRLHDVIQVAMGWDDYHLHLFKVAGKIYGDPEDDETGMMETKNEARYRLNQLRLREKSKFSYEYDFGDSWEHTLLVEKILPAEKGVHYPVCVAGKRAGPPEDVGGVWGYMNFLEVLADPDHPEYADMLEWVGEDFDPEAFDLDEVNEFLRAIQSGRRAKAVEPDPELDDDDDFGPSTQEMDAVTDKMVAWVKSLSPEQAETIENLPLRRDVLTLIDYLAKNRTVGTQATGNLPLKAVRAICAKFVNPPALEENLGGHVYKVRSEDEVWPLVFVHQLAFSTGLVTGGEAQPWNVTKEGGLFSQLPSPVQLYMLMVSWWAQVDWVIAFPVSGLANGLPDDFSEHTFNCVRELPAGENSSFEAFAGRLIKQSGLSWAVADSERALSLMETVIQRVVVGPLTSFGVLECEYGTKKIGEHEFRDLKFIRLTSLGKGMLDSFV